MRCPNCAKTIGPDDKEALWKNECCWCGAPLTLPSPEPVEEFAELPPTCFVEADPPEPKPKQYHLALRITGKVLFWLLSLVAALIVIAIIVAGFVISGSIFGGWGVVGFFFLLLCCWIVSAINRLTKAIQEKNVG